RSVLAVASRAVLWTVALAAVVAVSHAVLVLLFGRVPSEDERRLLLVAVASMAVAAVLFAALRDRVSHAIRRLTGGDRATPGELQGVLVIERPAEERSFSPDDERALVEVARQLGVVLHNAKLDSALQASFDEVRRQAAEIQASRGRIVVAADRARRKIERDLHDGAQQHIVALAVRVKLAGQLLDRDPAQARAALDEIGVAIQDTLQEMRDLAHGI